MKHALSVLFIAPLCGCSAVLPFDDLSEGKTTRDEPCAWALSPETRSETGGRPFALEVADFDGDAIADVVVAENDHFGDVDYASIEVLLNRGEQKFESWYVASKNSSPGGSMITRGIATADVNADGLADAVQTYSSFDDDSGSLDLNLGIGDGRLDWQGIWTIPKAEDVALGDFDGDGALDAVVVALTNDEGYANERLHFAWGDGQGSFELPVAYQPSGVFTKTLREITSDDLNADGRSDLLISSWGDASLYVLLGTADRGMIELDAVPVGTAPVGVAAADFDGDGKRDVAVVNSNDFNVSILFGTGDGNLERETPLGVGKDMQPIRASDLDADGDFDLAIGARNQLFVLLNAGDGSFAEPLTHALDGTPGRFAVADFDQNGFADVALSNLERNSFSVFWGACEK